MKWEDKRVMNNPSGAARFYGPERQLQIYIGAWQGQTPLIPLRYETLEQRAKEVLGEEAFDYVAGGAGSEDTLHANREAFRRWHIVPRMLRNVSERTLSIQLFNHSLPAPVLLAPVGVQSIVHSEGELAVARAAASLGIPLILSTLSSYTLEEVAQVMGDAPRWFQLYWSNDSDLTASFISRAEKAGYSAIVVTLDTPTTGWRERDLQHAYLPFFRGEGIANYLSDPVFRAALPRPPEEELTPALLHFATVFGSFALTWNDLAFLRERTRLPILLKGILHAEDAQLAIEHGADGIIVSNHGGRQVDGAIPALVALPDVSQVVQGRLPVLFDSGIRRGADAFKAIALGAKAVLLGRPYLWGLALAGEQGVREVLLNFLADLDLTLALSGYASFEELEPSALVGAPLSG